MAPSFKSRLSLITVLIAGCALFYVLERLIEDLPLSYEAAQSTRAPPGLDNAAWERVQIAVERERGRIAEKIDAVGRDTVATRKKQSMLEERMEKMRGERSRIAEYQEDLLQKLKSLELERKDAYSAAETCEKGLKTCASPADVEAQCVAATKDLSLRAKLEEEGDGLRQAVADLVQDAMDKDQGCTTKRYIDDKWHEALRRSAQDDVGMRDFALEDLGGSVVTGGGGVLTSATHTPKGAKFTTAQACGLGLQQCYDIGGPAEAINKEKEKGRCFAFDGSSGSLTVKLADGGVTPFAFTLEHLNKVFSEQGAGSAPKAFKVYGYEDERALSAAAAALQKSAKALAARTVAEAKNAAAAAAAQGGAAGGAAAVELPPLIPSATAGEVLLLEGSYDIDAANPVQTFYDLAPGAKRQPVKYVRLAVDTNHGNPNYTCLYRFRVHED